ncbi:MAG TPA: HNH endonuclease signature motif containing protein [Anaerolineae bacterium]|nr:HNH endonuclease signature motif containing protein [Anaerolineae bacterium]
MAIPIPATLRAAVVERAGERCEYCHKPQISFYPHEVDHVVAVKHGGETTLDNLAFACFQCNRYKGSDLASIDPQSGAITPLFNPRTQHWADHFRLDGATIVPLTSEGRATVFLLRLNDPERIQERAVLNVKD